MKFDAIINPITADDIVSDVIVVINSDEIKLQNVQIDIEVGSYDR